MFLAAGFLRAGNTTWVPVTGAQNSEPHSEPPPHLHISWLLVAGGLSSKHFNVSSLQKHFSSQEVSKNLTKENEQIKEDVEEIRTEMNKRSKENCSDNILDSMPDIRSALQRDAAAAYAHPEVRPTSPGYLLSLDCEISFGKSSSGVCPSTGRVSLLCDSSLGVMSRP